MSCDAGRTRFKARSMAPAVPPIVVGHASALATGAHPSTQIVSPKPTRAFTREVRYSRSEIAPGVDYG